MAQFDVTGIDELMSSLEEMGNVEEVVPKMMDAGMEILQESVVKEASKHKDTGEMVASIKPTGLTRTANGGYYMCTRPTGYAAKKGKWKNARKGKGEGKGHVRVRNMEKLVWLEFGVKGRPATPVITTAILNAQTRVVEKMQEVFNRELER